jgi:hypothetical protein
MRSSTRKLASLSSSATQHPDFEDLAIRCLMLLFKFKQKAYPDSRFDKSPAARLLRPQQHS